MNKQGKLVKFVRWTVFLPSALLAGWVAWLIGTALNKLALTLSGVNPDSFFAHAFIELVSSAAMGAAFVYAGARIAPSQKEIVAYTLAGFALIAAGLMLYPALMVSNYWSVWAVVSLVFGIGIITYSIRLGELKLTR